MAYEFNSARTSGTEKIVSAYSGGVPATFSFHLWTYRTGDGASQRGRWVDNGTLSEYALANTSGTVANTYAFYTENGVEDWYFTRPAQNTWAPVGLKLDRGSVANDPTIFSQGNKLTLGSGLSQSATGGPNYSNASGTWRLGNRSDDARSADGYVAEFALWNVMLNDDEFFDLQRGVSPLAIRPNALVEYLPLVRSTMSMKVATAAAATGTAVVDHPRVWFPHRPQVIVPAAITPPAANRNFLPLLGVGDE